MFFKLQYLKVLICCDSTIIAMRCYYEVLQVPEDATDDVLKKSYRKLALKCHPDKNKGREAEADAEFKELSQAYTTLSDPQERAFYDRNKESILKGADDQGSTSDELNVFKYFSNRCYPGGFTDSNDGFYTVYRKFFHDLSLKDMEAMKDEPVNIPSFGDSLSDLEDVADFYGYWTSYCSSMSFAWADQIDIRGASCRYVEKRIERENRKFRDKEKKQFNEEIRNLVLFVRKRDPRWKRRVEELEERSREVAARREEHRLRQLEERQKQLAKDMENEALQKNNREYLEHLKVSAYELEHLKVSAYEAEHLKAMERSMRGNDSSASDEEGSEEFDELDDEDSELIELSCLVCIKTFSHEKAKEQHMKSKKHKIKLAQLLEEQNLQSRNQEEDAMPSGSGSNPEEEPMEEIVIESGSECGSGEEAKPKTCLSKKERKQKKLEKKMQKRKKSQQQYENSFKAKADDELFTSQNLNDEINNLNLDDEEMPLGKTDEDAKQVLSQGNEVHGEDDDDDDADDEGDSKRKQKRRAKKAKEKTSAPVSKKLESVNHQDAESEPVESTCMVCSSSFPSKNKLFQHIKSTGHAALKDASSASRKKGKAKKK
ncbi:DnaJ domain [Trinorchestia longiramus]|nr:DnaJ domain [Trinorchestia longiramus]